MSAAKGRKGEILWPFENRRILSLISEVLPHTCNVLEIQVASSDAYVNRDPIVSPHAKMWRPALRGSACCTTEKCEKNPDESIHRCSSRSFQLTPQLDRMDRELKLEQLRKLL